MKSYKIYLLLFIASIHLYTCSEKKNEEAPKLLDGTYEQIGYGRIVTIEDGNFVLYDKTDISCIPVFDGSISIYGDNLTLENDTLKLKDGINEYKYVRLANQFDLCNDEITEDKMNDPVYNFEVLAANFDRHYAYFELRKVNWDSLYTATKSKITSKTSDIELFRILDDMLDHFGDGHISLDAPSEIEEAAEALKVDVVEAEKENKTTYGDLQVAKIVSDHYLKDTLKASRSDLIKWGYMTDKIGYLQINLMMGHGNLSLPDSLKGIPYLRTYFNELENLETSEEHTRLEVKGIKATLRTVMDDLSDSDALVLDVRFNGGGKDEVAMEIMSNFNEKRQVVFSKKARFNDGFTPVNNVSLETSVRPYTKPVFILTSKHSASATEIMVLSSLLLENVHRIGSHTEGVFSDVMEKALPNGWEVGLSNEVYLDTKGNNYENIGIYPSINLDYPKEIQDFYRALVIDVESDKQKIIQEVHKVLK